MSLVVCVYVPTGIVLSTDSRTTGTISQPVQPTGTGGSAPVLVQTNVILSDSANKLFLLFDRFGVATFGDAIVNNLPIAHYVADFETRHASAAPTTTQDCANALLAYFRGLTPTPKIGLLVAGYDANVPWVLGLDVPSNVITRANVQTGTPNVNYGILRGGDTAVVDRLLSQPQFNPPFNVMQLQDAVDYSRHLVRSTIDQMRFEPRFATVGGPIDTLVLTSNQARWLAKKELYSA